MAETHDIGRHFWAWLKLDPYCPRYSVAPTYETTNDGKANYRGSRSIVLRIIGRWGVVLGKWEDNPALAGLYEDTPEWHRAVNNHLLRTLHSTDGNGYRAELTDEQIVREAVGNLAPDSDTEWTVLCALGLEDV